MHAINDLGTVAVQSHKTLVVSRGNPVLLCGRRTYHGCYRGVHLMFWKNRTGRTELQLMDQPHRPWVREVGASVVESSQLHQHTEKACVEVIVQ